MSASISRAGPSFIPIGLATAARRLRLPTTPRETPGCSMLKFPESLQEGPCSRPTLIADDRCVRICDLLHHPVAGQHSSQCRPAIPPDSRGTIWPILYASALGGARVEGKGLEQQLLRLAGGGREGVLLGTLREARQRMGFLPARSLLVPVPRLCWIGRKFEALPAR